MAQLQSTTITGSNASVVLRVQSPASSSLLFVSGSGNVGLGTTNPTQKLDVAGFITSQRFYPSQSNGTYIAGDTAGLTVEGTGYLYVVASQGSYFQQGVRFRNTISNDTNTFLQINGGSSNITYFNGSVGIAESAPTARLEVKGSGTTSATTTLRVENSNASSSLTILDNLNVGIGTDTPTLARLQVQGNVSASAFSGSLLGTASFATTAQTATTASFVATAQTASYVLNAVSASFATSASVARSASFAQTAQTATTATTASYVAAPGATTQVVFNSLGALSASNGFVFSGSNVGIGVASPTSRLEVAGPLGGTIGVGGSTLRLTNTDTGNYASITAGLTGVSNSGMQFSTDGTVRAVISSTGNFGIGTTAPGTLLQVGVGNTTANSLVRLGVSYDTSRNSRGGIDWHDSSNVTGKIHTEYDGTMVSMVFGSLYNSGYNSNNLMIIRGNGNVGIGETSPTARLEVKGSGTTSSTVAFRVEDANASSSMVVLDNANVGIGMSSPTLAKLQVQGNVSASSYTGSLFGTASFATSASFAGNSTSASFAISSSRTVSASYALTASFALNAGGGGSTINVSYNGASVGTFSLLNFTGSGVTVTDKGGGTVDIYIPTSGSGGGGTPAGADGQIQYNNGGSFGGAVSMSYDDTNHRVGIGTNSPGHTLTVVGAISITGSNLNSTSLRFQDSSGVSRNALYVSSSNWLTVGNTNYAGVDLLKSARLSGSLFDINNSTGSVNQVLTSTANGIAWANATGGGSGSVSGSIYTIPYFSSSTLLYSTSNEFEPLFGYTVFNGNTPRSVVDVNNATTPVEGFRIREPYTPTDSNDSNGHQGQIAWDDNYIYVKTANNGWMRAQLTAF